MGGILKILLRRKDAQSSQVYLQKQVTRKNDNKMIRSQEKWTFFSSISLRNKPNTTITKQIKRKCMTPRQESSTVHHARCYLGSLLHQENTWTLLKHIFQGKIPNQNYHNNVSKSHLIVSKSKMQWYQDYMPLNICFHPVLWSSNAVLSSLHSQSKIQGNIRHQV